MRLQNGERIFKFCRSNIAPKEKIVIQIINCEQKYFPFHVFFCVPPLRTHLDMARGFQRRVSPRSFKGERQQEELVALLLHLVRIYKSSICQCQGPDSKEKIREASLFSGSFHNMSVLVRD